MKKLSDAAFAARARAQNADRQTRIREARTAAGLVSLTCWIPAEVKAALTARAAESGQPIGEITAALLLDALDPLTAMNRMNLPKN